MRYSASAPGSGFLLGEYAVLCGGPALVCALAQRIHVALQLQPTRQFCINSALGTYQGTLDQVSVVPPFAFVLQAIALLQPPTGFTLHITGNLANHFGLGSSAAVTIATLGAFNQWLGCFADHAALLRQACCVVRAVQGQGSGADLAASLYGGVVLYQADALVQRFLHCPAVHLVYVGYKFPTKQAIVGFVHQQHIHPQRTQAICQAIEAGVHAGVSALHQQAWPRLGRILTQQQQYLHALDASNADLDRLIDQCLQHPGVYGAKISGSGRGDCIVALGQLSPGVFPVDDAQAAQGVVQLSLPIAYQGLLVQQHQGMFTALKTTRFS